MMSMAACSCLASLRAKRSNLSRWRLLRRACARLAMTKSHSLPVGTRLLAGAVAFQRALVADRVRALEDPVLPGGEPGEDLRLHRFRPAEAQVRFHRGERVGGEARALLEKDADLVLPVDV